MSLSPGALSELGGRLSRFTERWIPDSWVVCMMITVLVLVLAIVGPGVSLQAAVLAWGGSMWTLLELSMQLSLALIAAHACVSSPPIFRSLEKLSGLPNPTKPVQAVVKNTSRFRPCRVSASPFGRCRGPASY